MADKYLTSVVTPGKQYAPEEAWTRSKHNLGFRPSVQVKGTVNQLNDVDHGSPVDGDVLAYDSGLSKYTAADSEFQAATSLAAGRKGIIPAPPANAQDKFLRGNKSWSTITAYAPGQVRNGDFEIDDDADGVPDEWTTEDQPKGVGGVWPTSSCATDRKFTLSKSWKVTASTPNGRYLWSGLIAIEPCRSYEIRFANQAESSTDAGVAVVVKWFAGDGVTVIGSLVLVPDSETIAVGPNWVDRVGVVQAPATAYFVKIRIDSCISKTGTVWWDNVRIVKPDWAFRSGLVNWTGARVGVAHNLGTTPSRVACVAKCIAPSGSEGYTLGDIIPFGHDAYVSGTTNFCIAIFATATHCIYVDRGTTELRVPNKGGTNHFALSDNAVWELMFYAWL
jgi:hypothetical protein